MKDRIDSDELGIDIVLLKADRFRMDRIDNHTFWLAAYNGNIRTTFTLSANKDCKITAQLIEDHQDI